MIGALLGLGTQMYSNALRKLPYMRRISLSYLKSKIDFDSFLFFYWISIFINLCICRSMGACAWNGIGSSVREPAGEMGSSA